MNSAIAHSWPSLAVIHFNPMYISQGKKHGEAFTCSGALIDPTTVLTTAKCVLNEPFYAGEIKRHEPIEYHISGFRVYLGVHDIKDVLNHRLTKDIVKVGIEHIFVVK